MLTVAHLYQPHKRMEGIIDKLTERKYKRISVLLFSDLPVTNR